jgi:hypothetical protein
MIISDLTYVENISESTSIQGGTGFFPLPSFGIVRKYTQTDMVSVNFNSVNTFQTIIDAPGLNSAAAGAKGDVITGNYPAFSFSKADTLAVAKLYGDSFSLSTSVAVATPY